VGIDAPVPYFKLSCKSLRKLPYLNYGTVLCFGFRGLPRDAMHSVASRRGLCRREMSVCLSVSVRPSHAAILTRRLSSTFFIVEYHSSSSIPNGMAIFLTGASNAEAMKKTGIFDQYLA